MRHLRSTGFVLVLAAVILLAACGGKSSGSGSSNGFTITVTPPTASVTLNGTRQFTALARDANGILISNVKFSWASSDSRIALSLGNGDFKALALGSVSVSATATLGGGVTGATPQTITSNAATLSVVAAAEGTAAEGAPIPGASVSLRDAQGQYAAGGTDEMGHFLIPTAGMTAPYLLKVTAADGRVLYGMAAADGTANLDPYSDLLVREAFALKGRGTDAAFAGNSALPDAATLAALDRAFRGFLATPLREAGLDAAHFSVLGTPFAADHAGFDRVLDESRVDTAANRIQLPGETIRLLADSSTGILAWEVDQGGLSTLGQLKLP
jgi:hypothetical protein